MTPNKRLPDLPTELLHLISSDLDLKENLSLCRVARRLHAICLERIYGSLTLENLPKILRACKTILSRPEAGSLVRELRIVCHTKHAVFEKFYNILQSALRQMTNLRILHVWSPKLFGAVASIDFPKLRECTLPGPSGSTCFPFLRRHPTITCLYMIAEEDSLPSPHPTVVMPELYRFEGTDEAARCIVPGSPVSLLGIVWPARENVDFLRGFESIAASTSEVIHLSTLIYSWDPALVVHVRKYIPNIQHLQIMNPLGSLTAPISENDFLTTVEITLRSLPCLIGIVIAETSFHRSFPIDLIASALESQFDLVRRWGDFCPTLLSVCLSSEKTTWHRVVDDMWFPGNPLLDCAESLECIKWLLGRIARSPDLPAIYRSFARYFGGSAGFSLLEEAAKRDEDLPPFDLVRLEDGRTVIDFSYNL
ncbi:F-box domain-containing protein [Favolaschia claudopus]|uniref:F-box domain-containing protein n=1 Tax=Favolaschia claudopus TaxID=2862362 RepID=A0AAW0DN74_9AGAR